MPYADPGVQRAYQARWRRQRWLDWVTRNGPCLDCGSWDQLEVDHVDAHTKVDHRIWTWSAVRRAAELQKCVVRCAPCHDKKSASEAAIGEQNGRAKLTAQSVREIRRSGLPVRVIARQYGLHHSTVKAVIDRKTWTHVQD